nr:immunoglobulin light chain junction region [Macaca mulatta]
DYYCQVYAGSANVVF